MKKQIFFGYWFYLLSMAVITLLSVVILAIEVWQMVTVSPTANPTVTDLYWCMPITAAVVMVMIFLTGYYAIQIVILSEEGIKVRCLWCTIRKVKWSEIKEIRYEKLNVSTQGGFTSSWFVFDDGVVRKQIGNGSVLRRNANHITLHYSKRACKAIEYFSRKPVKEIIRKV